MCSTIYEVHARETGSRGQNFGFWILVPSLTDPKWHKIKTRRQPERSNLCGPYVMKHLYDIVTEGNTKVTLRRFACEEPFDDDEIEHIRE
ncbi:hypothetical protein K1719_045783 [Acacia pycnantha]|nr:hypothetical protein K1719_045783 [Acacia pycnantha]